MSESRQPPEYLETFKLSPVTFSSESIVRIPKLFKFLVRSVIYDYYMSS